MLKRTLATVLVLLWCGVIYAQDKPTIYRGVYIKPKAGMVDKVEDGFKDHNKKFHMKEGLEVTTFQMMSGPKMGWYLRIMGGADWENFDKYTEPAGDAEHWAKYITPYIDEVPMQFAGQFYARLLSDLSYNYERTSMSRVLTDDVRPGMGGKYYSILSKAKEAEEKTDGEVRYAVYTLADGGNVSQYSIIYAIDSWSDLNPRSTGLGKRINKVHGEGTLTEMWKQFSEVVTKRTSEVRPRRPDLSTMK